MPGGRLHKAWCSGSVLERGESGEGIGLFSLDHLVARVFIVHLAVVVKRHGGKRQDRLLLNPVGDGETAAADDNLLIITLFIERERIGLCSVFVKRKTSSRLMGTLTGSLQRAHCMTTVPSNERLAAGSRSTMPSPVTLNFREPSSA